MALTRKLVLVKIFTSNHFRTHAQREREREREREERTQITPRTQSPDHAMNPEPGSRFRLRRSTNRSMNPRTDLRPRAFNPRAFDFAGDPEPSRYEPANQSLSLCDFDRPTNRLTFLCDFDFLLSL